MQVKIVIKDIATGCSHGEHEFPSVNAYYSDETLTLFQKDSNEFERYIRETSNDEWIHKDTVRWPL